MPHVTQHATPSASDLCALLVLLHEAEGGFGSVEASYRVWRHEERLHAAFIADAEEQKRRGASISTFSVSSGEPEPPEHEETLRIWRDRDRCRVEHHGGRRDGYYAVANGSLWWIWDERMGARSNQDDPSVGSGVGQELEVMVNPTPLLSSLRFEVTGTSRLAGRATVTARATPRARDPRFGRSFELHQLGTGAERYELEVDHERGALLAVVAIRDEEPFHKITTLAIAFDQPIPEEIFQFEPPEGEQIRGRSDLHPSRHVTLIEAQQQAPFTVLRPERVPDSWQVRCRFMEASERPPSPAQVSLHYLSHDGHESVSITQMAAAAARDTHYKNMINADGWEEVIRDGTTLTLRAPGGQAQAHLERDGTFVFLVSDNLTGDQLTTIAAGLRPAPTSGSI